MNFLELLGIIFIVIIVGFCLVSIKSLIDDYIIKAHRNRQTLHLIKRILNDKEDHLNEMAMIAKLKGVMDDWTD